MSVDWKSYYYKSTTTSGYRVKEAHWHESETKKSILENSSTERAAFSIPLNKPLSSRSFPKSQKKI